MKIMRLFFFYALFAVAARACSPLVFVDRYEGKLASGYTSGATSMSITSATSETGSTVLPSGATCFYLAVKPESSHTEELCLVTNRSGTTLTVACAQAGTSASNHASNAKIIASVMTAAAFTQLKADSGMVLLESHAASSSAALNFTSCLSSAYDVYQIDFVNLVAASGTVLYLQVSTDGGSSYDTTSGHYSWEEVVSNPSIAGSSPYWAGAGLASADAVEIINSLDSSLGFSGTLKLYGPAASKKEFTGQGTTSSAIWLYGGEYNQATTINAFRITGNGVNLASGTVRCYGLSK
jgi:hypothetical protein